MSDPSPFVPMATNNIDLQNNLANASLGMNSTSLPAPSSSNSFNTSTTNNNSQKLEHFKSWSINTLKVAKQQISEIIGNKEKTVNKELDDQIMLLRETQTRYKDILRLAKSLATNYTQIVNSNRELCGLFGDLSHKTPDLYDAFNHSCEVQSILHKNGDIMILALNNFISSLQTLCNKTIEDTLNTVASYNQTRIEYDTYKSDLEGLEANQTGARVELARQRFSDRKEKFEQLQQDVNIKLKFLNENKQKVMYRQLLGFNNALAVYCTGNGEELAKHVSQMGLKIMDKAGSSFIEKQ